ncbi:MAG: class I SAM-dependent methyltransferase [Bacilli bacterium]
MKEKIEQAIIDFWDMTYAEMEPCKVKESDLEITGGLEDSLLFLNDSTKDILDVGSGDGTMLMKMAFHDCGNNYLGLDSSNKAVAFANQTSALSGLKKIHFQVGSLKELSLMKEASFDGLLCSNFLDVIPLTDAELYIKQLIRLLDKPGYLVLKVNFLIDSNHLKNPAFDKRDDGIYINNIYRCSNQDDDYWIKAFEPLKLIKKSSYQRSLKLPPDRIMVFKKIS